MIEEVREKVRELLDTDKSGHGMNHIDRVLNLSLKFAKEERADEEIVTLIALLHDVDDYKLFDEESSKNLTNAKKIMESVNIDIEKQNKVCESLRCIGYRKRLKGIVVETLEGKIVSDADMCDCLGVSGIIRTCMYHQKNNSPFFDKNIFPVEDVNEKTYKKCADSGVCHIFEKVLKIKDLMLTKSGKEEAKSRYHVTIDFLYNLFYEENAPEWIEYLDNYLKINEQDE